MKTHELKTWPKPFQAVWDGLKPYEFRLNDRHFEVGDFLVLKEYDNEQKQYTRRIVNADITYITDCGYWSDAYDFVVLGIKITKRDVLRGMWGIR